MNDDAPFQEYVGREERREDQLHPLPLEGMAAELDCRLEEVAPNKALPALWHWMFFTPWVRHSEIGPEGHPERGGFLPPIDLPRRMFAGSRTRFLGKLYLGDSVSRTATIRSVTAKTGSAGPMVFVTTQQEISGPKGVAVVEEQDIVYIGPNPPADSPDKPPPAPDPLPEGAWVREVTPDPVMLFRFSALTCNGHRIHYDRTYATETEGYPGLVVHGPLQAILLMDLLRHNRPDAQVSAFEFRAHRPLFDTEGFHLVGEPAESEVALTTRNLQGKVCVQAKVTLK